MCLRAASGEMPIGTSSTITPISPSKSMPQASSASSMSSSRPMKESEPPWYISGSVQKRRRHLDAARLAHQLDMDDVGRAVGPLIGARQRRGQRRGVELEGARRLVVGELPGERAQPAARCVAQSSSAFCRRRRDAAGPHRPLQRRGRPRSACRRGRLPSRSPASSLSSSVIPSEAARPAAQARDLRCAHVQNSRRLSPLDLSRSPATGRR